MKPFISVVVPAYNEEKRLPNCLKTLVALSYPKESFEIIIVDNGSTDKTASVAESFGVRVESYTQTKGVSGARQAGSEAAKGEIIAFTDSDCLVPSDWLTKIAQVFENKSLVALGGEVLPSQPSLLKKFLYKLYHWFLILNQAFGKVLPWGSNLAIKKEALLEVGGFDKSLKTSEDWDISLRLQKKFGADKVFYTREVFVYASTRKQDNLIIFLKYFLDGIPGYIKVLLFGKTKSGKMMVVR